MMRRAGERTLIAGPQDGAWFPPFCLFSEPGARGRGLTSRFISQRQGLPQ